MHVVGAVTEYNPFHNGHLRHLEESRRVTGCEAVICVMSGNFTQRGEPAIVDKWSRARMALANGADLVIELPVIHAVSSAEYFAAAAIGILNASGVVDHVCFGSESGDIAQLDKIAELLADEPAEYSKQLKAYLDTGLSYPTAREKALSGIIPESAHIVRSSNNILGIEYLKALKRLQSPMKPATIKRIGGEYKTLRHEGPMPGATSIRTWIKTQSGKLVDKKSIDEVGEGLRRMMPHNCADILIGRFKEGRGPVFLGSFTDILLAQLRKTDALLMKALPEISEGLENRIINAAGQACSFDDLLSQITTKRYAETRIMRILLYSLLGITAADFDTFNKSAGPQYIRVLGFNKTGQSLLAAMRKKSSLPVITKFAAASEHENPLVRRTAQIEAASTDIYVLGFPSPSQRYTGQDYTRNVIRI